MPVKVAEVFFVWQHTNTNAHSKINVCHPIEVFISREFKVVLPFSVKFYQQFLKTCWHTSKHWRVFVSTEFKVVLPFFGKFYWEIGKKHTSKHSRVLASYFNWIKRTHFPFSQILEIIENLLKTKSPLAIGIELGSCMTPYMSSFALLVQHFNIRWKIETTIQNQDIWQTLGPMWCTYLQEW